MLRHTHLYVNSLSYLNNSICLCRDLNLIKRSNTKEKRKFRNTNYKFLEEIYAKITRTFDEMNSILMSSDE